MKNFDKILFPVDLSDISPQLAPYVAEMAKKFDSEIHLLFVVRILDHLSGYYVSYSSIDKFQKEIVGGAEKRIEEFKNKYFENSKNTTSVVTIGDISEEILRYIENNGIDLLIMGTHGRKGIDKIFFGSIADRITKTAPIPVLLVNPYKIP